MAITEIEKDGVKNYTIYINLRSKIMPHIRLQKRVKGIQSKAEAIRRERNLLLDLSRKVSQEEGHGFTWRMIVNKWAATVSEESYIDKDYNPATIKDYVSMMQNWTKTWLDRPASEITKGEGREALNSVLEEGRTKSFQKRLKNTINMIYTWAIENRLIRGVHHSPVYGLKIKPKTEQRPEILKAEEIRRLLYESKATNHEWYPVWAMALLTGMRNGELYALKWEDVDLDSNFITVQRAFNRRMNCFKSTKAGYWRSVPISSELRLLILEIKQKSRSEYVLPRIIMWRKGGQAQVLKAFCRSIGLPEINFHTLRACFATQLIGSGVEPIKVMKVCGWKDLKTMSYYLRLSGIDEKGVTEGLNFLPKNEGNVLSIHF
jgi:integrase